jgi:hypothetical protein
MLVEISYLFLVPLLWERVRVRAYKGIYLIAVFVAEVTHQPHQTKS